MKVTIKKDLFIPTNLNREDLVKVCELMGSLNACIGVTCDACAYQSLTSYDAFKHAQVFTDEV